MKKVLFGVATLIVMMFCTTGVFAEPSAIPVKADSVVQGETQEQDPIERLQKEMTSRETKDIAFGVMSPGLKIGGIIFIILGIILTVGSVGYLSICLVKALFGKGKVGKSHLGLAGAALFLGILLLGGAIFGILKFGKNVGVDPVNNQILDPGIEAVSSAAPKTK